MAPLLILAILLFRPRLLNAMADVKSYTSAQEAVLQAMREAIELSKKDEFGGLIYELDGKFYYTPPESSGKKGELRIKARVPKGSNLHGVYHTHTKGTEGSDRFSAYDVDIANKLGMPYYMGHTGSREVRVFTPGKTETTRVISPGGGRAQLESMGDLMAKLEALDQHRLKLAEAKAIAAQKQGGSK